MVQYTRASFSNFFWTFHIGISIVILLRKQNINMDFFQTLNSKNTRTWWLKEPQ